MQDMLLEVLWILHRYDYEAEAYDFMKLDLQSIDLSILDVRVHEPTDYRI